MRRGIERAEANVNARAATLLTIETLRVEYLRRHRDYGQEE